MKANKYKIKPTSKDATGCYFASVLLDDGAVQPEKVKHIEFHVGLDRGISHFVTLSTGEKVDNPRFVNKQQHNLRRKQSKNSRLARHILDIGWHDFTTKLNYKLADRGHHLVKNDRFYASSKTCHCCGHKVDKLPLNIRKWDCTVCGTTHDRDENAAINLDKAGMIKLKAEGYTVSARGGFNVSRVSMNPQTPTKRDAPFIALA